MAYVSNPSRRLLNELASRVEDEAAPTLSSELLADLQERIAAHETDDVTPQTQTKGASMLADLQARLRTTE